MIKERLITPPTNKKEGISFSSRKLILITFVILIAIPEIQPLINPRDAVVNLYLFVRIARHTNWQSIQEAYADFVRKWNPDNNDRPEAKRNFREITASNELLTDPERRHFRNNGTRVESGPRPKRDVNDRYYNSTNSLEDLVDGTYKLHHESNYDIFDLKMTITQQDYKDIIIPNSYHTPFLILFYCDKCNVYPEIISTWRRISNELEPLGVGLATVNGDKESLLVRKVGLNRIPSFVFVLDGHANVYKESLYNAKNVVEFVRNKFPYRLIQHLNNANIDSFLSGWVDNKIRAVIFEKEESPTLKYLLLSHYHKDRVAFGFVQIGQPETEAITTKYNVSGHSDTVLIFNENSEKPMASISMEDIPSEMLHDVISNNKFLMLPRLSYQAMLDSVCPAAPLKSQKRLCAILISEDTPLHDLARRKFRQAAMESPYSNKEVRYAYVFKDAQPDFMSVLTDGKTSPHNDSLLHIVIIWRKDAKSLKYEWLSTRWIEATEDEHEWDDKRKTLEEAIQRLLHTSEDLPHTADIRELADEHALGQMDRIIGRAKRAAHYYSDNLPKDTSLTLISFVASVALIGVAGYVLLYLENSDEESVEADLAKIKGRTKRVAPIKHKLILHELRLERYDALVRLLKPGCRTIILLVDAQSRRKLLPAFRQAAWPYRKNKSLNFGHLSLEQGLDWYKSLLSTSFDLPADMNINAKNCTGTVLSICGYNRYFCMYHAKHRECNKGKGGSKRVETKKLSRRKNDVEVGSFTGVSSSSESDVSQDERGSGKALTEDRLLDGLPAWLEQLFGGLTRHHYISDWPEFPNLQACYLSEKRRLICEKLSA